MAPVLAQNIVLHSSARVGTASTRRGRVVRASSARRELSTTQVTAARANAALARDDNASTALGRRDAIATMAVSALALATRAKAANAEEVSDAIDAVIDAPAAPAPTPRALATQRVASETLAYAFHYPVEADSGKPIS